MTKWQTDNSDKVHLTVHIIIKHVSINLLLLIFWYSRVSTYSHESFLLQYTYNEPWVNIQHKSVDFKDIIQPDNSKDVKSRHGYTTS